MGKWLCRGAAVLSGVGVKENAPVALASVTGGYLFGGERLRAYTSP